MPTTQSFPIPTLKLLLEWARYYWEQLYPHNILEKGKVKPFDLGWVPPELNSKNVCVTDDFKMYLLGKCKCETRKGSLRGACIDCHCGPVCLFLPGTSNRWHWHHYPTQGVILKDSVMSFLWTARKLCLHPLMLIHHRLKATPRGINSIALQAEGKLQVGTCGVTPISGTCWNGECPENGTNTFCYTPAGSSLAPLYSGSQQFNVLPFLTVLDTDLLSAPSRRTSILLVGY